MGQKNKSAPLVSIALMVYNREHYLPGLIDSLLAQTFQDFELILFDDASTDRAPKICKEYAEKDPRIIYVRPEKNLNVPASFKTALKLARGKYFMWAENDNLYEKKFIEDCLNVHRANPELIMTFAGMVSIDRNGKIIERPDPQKYIPSGLGAYERLKSQMLNFFSDGKNQLLYGLWKREMILDDPLFGPVPRGDQPPYYWGFENYFVFRNLAKGPFGFMPETRFFRRSRVLEDARPPRPLIPRLAVSLYNRLKIFGSPYFCYIAWQILKTKGLTPFEKLKLLFWNFFAAARIFFARKI